MLRRRLPVSALLAVTLAMSACSASGSDASSPTTAGSKTTTTASKQTTITDQVTATEKSTTTEGSTTSDPGTSDDDVKAIADQLKGGDFTDAQATCFAKAFVADASPAGVKVAMSSNNSDPTDLSSADLEVFKMSTDQCVDIHALADAAAKGALDELDKATLTGNEGSCVSDGIATKYRSSGEFLVQILTNSATAQQQVSAAIGACLQPATLKALITKQIGDKVDPAVADCVAQGIIDQNGGTAGAFAALSAAGSSGDSKALEAQATSLTQTCIANPGG